MHFTPSTVIVINFSWFVSVIELQMKIKSHYVICTNNTVRCAIKAVNVPIKRPCDESLGVRKVYIVYYISDWAIKAHDAFVSSCNKLMLIFSFRPSF